MRELLELAAARGLTVHATHMPIGYLGFWDPASARIWFDIGLTPAERRVVIAHELGHEFYGDCCDSDRAEARANAYAAALLIDPADYATLEASGADLESIADELTVTVECVRDFRHHCLRQVGRSVYVKRPRDRERRVA